MNEGTDWWTHPLQLAIYLIFGLGVLIIVVRCLRSWTASRTLRVLRDRLVTPYDELEQLLIDWPQAEAPILEPLRLTLDKGRGRRASAIDLESPQRAISARVGQWGAFVRPLASTLIILSLLMTFLGMKNATTNLRQSLSQISVDVVVEQVPGENQASNTTFKDFRDKVSDALEDMSTAFGANLYGIGFAALLVLLLPILRDFQQRLLTDVRAFVDEVVRPVVAGDAQGRERDLLLEIVRQLGSESAKAIREEMSVQTNQLRDSLSNMTTQIRDLSAALGPALTNALEAAREQTRKEQEQRLREQNTLLDDLRGQYERIVTMFAAAGNRVQTVVDLQRETASAIERQLVTIGHTHEAGVKSLVDAQAAGNSVIERTAFHLDAMTDSFSAKLIARLVEWQKSTDKVLASASAALETGVASLSRQVGSLEQGTSTTLGTLTVEVAAASNALRTQVAAVEDWSRSTASDLVGLTESIRSMLADLDARRTHDAAAWTTSSNHLGARLEGLSAAIANGIPEVGAVQRESLVLQKAQLRVADLMKSGVEGATQSLRDLLGTLEAVEMGRQASQHEYVERISSDIEALAETVVTGLGGMLIGLSKDVTAPNPGLGFRSGASSRGASEYSSSVVSDPTSTVLDDPLVDREADNPVSDEADER
jgi:hypothetical protein